MPETAAFSYSFATLQQLAEDVLKHARDKGATACEVDVSEGFGQSVGVRCDEVETIDVSKQLVGHVGHAGGDTRLVDNIIDILRKDDLEHNLTSIDASVHSHVMALAAEESRVNHGKSISIREFESKF